MTDECRIEMGGGDTFGVEAAGRCVMGGGKCAGPQVAVPESWLAGEDVNVIVAMGLHVGACMFC